MSNKHTGCSVLAKGDDLTFVGISLGAMEGIKIAKVFDFFGIKVNVINLRSVVPLDISTIVKSVEITKKLVILDIAQTKFGVAETISENVMRQLWNKLDNTPLVLGLKNIPVPSSPTLAKQVYPSTLHSTLRINEEFNLGVNSESLRNKFVEMWPVTSEYEDQPDLGLVGPF
jgi:pyruvate/2-oxoglutarate/acetoin dehydrogenase E1 component